MFRKVNYKKKKSVDKTIYIHNQLFSLLENFLNAAFLVNFNNFCFYTYYTDEKKKILRKSFIKG